MNPPPASALALALLLTVSACAGGDAPADDARPDVYYPGRLDETAPERFRARFETTAGDFVVEVHRSWSPLGADRFYNLAKNGYYDDTRIFRVVPDFMVQFGIAGDPVLEYQWRDATLRDDPVVESNTRGRVTFAMSGRNSRINQIFINYRDNRDLDAQGFSPFGEVVEGMEVVDAFYAEYGDGPPRGDGPYQAQVLAQGNAYLDAEFPELTRIVRATVEEEDGSSQAAHDPLAAQEQLGAALFSDETFDGNGRVCATCHILEAHGSITPEFIQARYEEDPTDPLFRSIDSDDGLGASFARLLEHATVRVKVESQVHEPYGLSVRRCDAPAETEITVNRGNPSVYNVALEDFLMSDAREGGDLDTQALNAVLSHAEPGREPTPDELAAIAAFQRTLFSHDAIRAHFAAGGDLVLPEGRTESERRGREFMDEDRQCGICHSGPMLHQTSAAHTDVVGARVESGLVGMEPENPNPKYEWCYVDPATNEIVEGPMGKTRVFEAPAADPGIALLAEGYDLLDTAGDTIFTDNLILSALVGPSFKIPTLWGTPDTAPYFHDNSAKTLEEAVEHYNFMFREIPGFGEAAGCDMERVDCLDERDIVDIVAYLQLLSFEDGALASVRAPTAGTQ